jgi:hypothetical protein
VLSHSETLSFFNRKCSARGTKAVIDGTASMVTESTLTLMKYFPRYADSAISRRMSSGGA